MIEAVLLDVGGVFLLPDVAVLSAAIRPWLLDVSAADLRRGHYAGIAAMDTTAVTEAAAAVAGGRALPTADWPGYNGALVRELGIDDDHADAAAEALGAAYLGLGWNEVIPGSLDALRRLADTGVSLGIVSNSDGTVAEQLLTARICQVGHGEGVAVTVVLDSHLVGIEKPDPRIFHHALDELGVAPEHAIHVGDTGWADVVGARAAGVRPVHLDPFGFCPRPDDHEHARDLDEVAAIVEQARGA